MAFHVLDLLKMEVYKYTKRQTQKLRHRTCKPGNTHVRKKSPIWQCAGKTVERGNATVQNPPERIDMCLVAPLECLFQEIMKVFCFLIWVLVTCVCSVCIDAQTLGCSLFRIIL